MDRERIAAQFYMEEHATLYALLAKNAIVLYGQEGRDATREATKLYGRERGGRMAKRALRDGKELSMLHYTQYSEWEDSRGYSASRIVAFSPAYTTESTRCGWCEAWKKHGLLEYGKLYCENIDAELVKGFNPENQLVLTSTLSHGQDCCHFEWVGCSFADEAEYRATREEKAAMGDRNLKDFLYHTGHLLSAMGRKYEELLGVVKAGQIVEASLAQFEVLFGKEKAEALKQEALQNYSVI